MSHESKIFFSLALPLGFLGILIATLLGWGDTGTFFAAMGPGSVVMLVMMLRERKQEQLDHRMQPPAHRGA